MRKLGMRLFLVSFVFALVAAGLAWFYLNSLSKEEVKVETVKVLVAKETIPPRTIIEKDMIDQIEIPKDGVLGDFIKDENEIVGKYTKETILKGEQFHSEKLIQELEEELSLKIRGNHRAVSIFVNGESGVADLIKAGDFVDVLVFLPEIKEAERIVRPNLSKMILQNIEVLGIDKNLYRDGEEREEIPTNAVVTLSVPVYDLEKLTLAEDIGDLKLAMRPLEDDYIYSTEGTIWEELLLDDFYKMKDLFPQYEINPPKVNQAKDEKYQYEKYYYYTIQYGDTLRSISRKFYGGDDQYILLRQMNHIEDEDKILAGTGIKVPVLEEKR